jgi:hypothetical protein
MAAGTQTMTDLIGRTLGHYCIVEKIVGDGAGCAARIVFRFETAQGMGAGR